MLERLRLTLFWYVSVLCCKEGEGVKSTKELWIIGRECVKEGEERRGVFLPLGSVEPREKADGEIGREGRRIGC